MLKNIHKTVLMALVALVGVVGLLTPAVAMATGECAGVETSIIDCSKNDNGGQDKSAGVWHIIALAINVLSAGIAVAALGGIIYGIVLYTSSGGEPAGVKKGIDTIRNTVIGLVAYAVMYSVLQWLIPGGIF